MHNLSSSQQYSLLVKVTEAGLRAAYDDFDSPIEHLIDLAMSWVLTDGISLIEVKKNES